MIKKAEIQKAASITLAVIMLAACLVPIGLGGNTGFTDTAYAEETEPGALVTVDEMAGISGAGETGPGTLVAVDETVGIAGAGEEPLDVPVTEDAGAPTGHEETGEEAGPPVAGDDGPGPATTEDEGTGTGGIAMIEPGPSIQSSPMTMAPMGGGSEWFDSAAVGESPYNIDTSMIHYRSDGTLAYSRQMVLNDPDGTSFGYSVNDWDPGEEKRMLMLFANVDRVAANYGITGDDKQALIQMAIWTIESGSIPSNPSFSSITSLDPDMKTALQALYYSITGGYASAGVAVGNLKDGELVYCGLSFDGDYAMYGPFTVSGATSAQITAIDAPAGSYFGNLFGMAIDPKYIMVGQQFYFFIPRYCDAGGTAKISVKMQGDTFNVTKYSGLVGYKDMIVFEGSSTGETVHTGTCAYFGEVEILKIDEYTGKALDGAEFELEYWFDGEWVKSKMGMIWDPAIKRHRTGLFCDSGATRLERIREVKAPYSYTGGWTMGLTFTKYGSYYKVNAVNRPVKLDICLYKKDRDTLTVVPQGDAVLEGAVYGLYMNENRVHPDGTVYTKDQKIAEATTDNNGMVEFTGLFPAQYYIKELSLSEGYLLDDTVYEINGVHDGIDEYIARDVVATEQVMKQRFKIVKTGKSGEGGESVRLEGAGFKVYLISELIAVDDGTLLPFGVEWTGKDFKDYDFSEDLTAKIDGVCMPELFTDAFGRLVSPELPYGKYVVIESTVPEGYLPAEPFIVTIDKDSRRFKTWHLTDLKQQLDIEITKTEKGTDALLSGAEFTLYTAEDIFIDEHNTIAKDEDVSVETTGEDGKAIFADLPPGSYYVIETKAPEGYVLNQNFKAEFVLAYDSGSSDETIIFTGSCENSKLQAPPLGISLPNTGGTIIPYLIALLLYGSVVAIIIRSGRLSTKRKAAEEYDDKI